MYALTDYREVARRAALARTAWHATRPPYRPLWDALPCDPCKSVLPPCYPSRHETACLQAGQIPSRPILATPLTKPNSFGVE